MVFTGLFSIETILKIVGFGFKVSEMDTEINRLIGSHVRFQKFFKDPWNVFDFVTVVGSLSEAVLSHIPVRTVSSPTMC